MLTTAAGNGVQYSQQSLPGTYLHRLAVSERVHLPVEAPLHGQARRRNEYTPASSQELPPKAKAFQPTRRTHHHNHNGSITFSARSPYQHNTQVPAKFIINRQHKNIPEVQ
jgi:hypothetical protein